MSIKEKYDEQMNKLYGEDGYIDPDSFDNKKYEEYNYIFYKDYYTAIEENRKKLVQDKVIKDSFKFVFDDDIKGIKGIGMLLKKSNIVLQLKSDQFGFSAAFADTKGKLYPYGAYINSLKGGAEETIKSGLSKVFDECNGWIKKTRKVGGSFLWPLEYDAASQYNPPYNGVRGGSCQCNKVFYIQDRVDLTLYEIKETYEKIIEPCTVCNNKLIGCLYETNMYKFLRAFGTFETFIKVFGFDGNFVRKVGNEWKIVNIFPYNCEDEDKTDRDDEYVYLNDKYVKKARCGDKLFKINTKAEDFENMFNVVCKLIEERRKKLSLN